MGIEVEVIALFTKEGKITPIKFRCEEDGNDRVVVVERVERSAFKKIAGIGMWEYTCISLVNNTSKTYILKYNTISGKWILFYK